MNGASLGLGDSSGYEIRTSGHIGDRWPEWFEGMDVIHGAEGTTVIRSPAIDQAALHGLLGKVRDLGLALISVTRTGAESAGATDAQSTNHIR